MRKIGVVLVLLVVCVVVMAFAIISHQTVPLTAAEREATFQKTLGRAARNPKVQTGLTYYRGSHDSFSYPASYTPYSYKENTSNPMVLDSFILQNRDDHIFFTTQVRISPGDLSSVPDVTLRKMQKDIYAESQGSIGGEPALIFTKNDTEFEKSGFVIKGATLYTFSATGTEQADEIFRIVTSSVMLY